MKKAFIKIDVEEAEDSLSIDVKVNGNHALIMVGLVEVLATEFIKFVPKQKLGEREKQLCDVIQKKIEEKSDENKASRGVWQ